MMTIKTSLMKTKKEPNHVQKIIILKTCCDIAYGIDRTDKELGYLEYSNEEDYLSGNVYYSFLKEHKDYNIMELFGVDSETYLSLPPEKRFSYLKLAKEIIEEEMAKMEEAEKKFEEMEKEKEKNKK